MTIGIAAHGPRAGLAVFKALAAVEKVGRGAIGGFVTYAALTGDGRLLRAQTQRGGTTTLFTEGEKTGVEPPPDIAEAPFAALMSSGPNRPEPLSQFVAGAPKVGLVTGHRLPNAPGQSGRPVNEETLDRLARGEDARRATETVLDANPEADAGLITLDLAGNIFSLNSARVQRRPDLGEASLMVDGAGVAVIHNAILPVHGLADLAAAIAMDCMDPADRTDGWITVNAGVPLSAGARDQVLVDGQGVATAVVTTDARILNGRWNCAAVYLGARVMQGDQCLGQTTFEPNMVVEDGRIVSMSGQESLRISYRR